MTRVLNPAQWILGLAAMLASFTAITMAEETAPVRNNFQTVTVGGGCFWCMEAIFQGFRGVEKVESGYAGGTVENPTYEDVAGRKTGHAEVIQITFDPSIITLRQLLTIFFHAHDPTTKDRQGNDIGPEYRSIILYTSEEQRAVAEQVAKEIADADVWEGKAIVTEVVPLKHFFRAEDYHQNYYRNNASAPYCSLVIGPKVQKIRREFRELLKPAP